MTPRPRKRQNRALPPNLYARNRGTSFVYRNPQTGQWHGMGADKLKAIAAAKELNAILAPDDNLVQAVLNNNTLADHIEWFMATIPVEEGWKPKTVEMYRTQTNKMVHQFADRQPSEIRVKELSDFMETLPPTTANQFRQVAARVFDLAVSKGLCESNPVHSTRKRKVNTQRQRLKLDDFRTIHAAAPTWLQNAMDLALLTLQRRHDVVWMKFDNVVDGYLYVIQGKTEKHDTGYLRIQVGSDLRRIIDRCRDDLLSPFLVHRRPERKRARKGAEHWTQVSEEMVSREFTRVRDEQGVRSDLSPAQRPTFHEIRALGVKLYRQQGVDPQKLAGHASEQMTANYEAGHDEIRWVDAAANLDIGRIDDDG